MSDVESPPIAQDAAPPETQPIGQVSGAGVEATVPPAPAPLDPAYVAKGQKWRMSEDELRQIPQHVFDRMAAAADNEILESLALAEMQAGGPPQSAPSGRQPTPPQQQPDQTGDPFVPLTVNFGADGDEDQTAPYRKHIESVVGWANQAVQAIRQQHDEEMQQVSSAFKQMREANDHTILDHYIASWGDEWSGVFGKGPNFMLSPNSQEFRHRGEMLTAAKRLIELDKRLGRSVNVSDALLRARAQRFSDRQSEISRAAQEKKLKEVQAQLPPATNRMGGFAVAGTNGSAKTSDADFLRRVRGG